MSATDSTSVCYADIASLLHGLFGLEISEIPAVESEIHSIAEFVDETGSSCAYLACDLATSCRLGAALTQIPAGRVDESVRTGSLPESIAENLYEVFNISVNLVAPAHRGRLVLRRVVHQPDEDFDAVRSALSAVPMHTFGFEIQRYGACSLTVGL